MNKISLRISCYSPYLFIPAIYLWIATEFNGSNFKKLKQKDRNNDKLCMLGVSQQHNASVIKNCKFNAGLNVTAPRRLVSTHKSANKGHHVKRCWRQWRWREEVKLTKNYLNILLYFRLRWRRWEFQNSLLQMEILSTPSLPSFA